MNFTKHYRIYLFLGELALEFSTLLTKKSLTKQRNSGRERRWMSSGWNTQT